ncbi:hypothetical protein ABZ299_16595 [Streptomyces sp. NPDC006184]|uniref:hypothetical protein n=1 Tax=Streptomyces sp. NPDC006184 TaxID=3155455 RepID=UPI0033B6EC59
MDRLTEIAGRPAEVRGVAVVAVGGSRAAGQPTATPTTASPCTTRPPLDTGALRLLAAELTGTSVDVTEPGGCVRGRTAGPG